MRRAIGVVVATAMLWALSVVAPASADNPVSQAHWPVYRWDGVRDTLERRAFWINVRTTDDRLWNAAVDVAVEWAQKPEVCTDAGDLATCGHLLPFIAVYRTPSDNSCPSADPNPFFKDNYSWMCLEHNPTYGGTGLYSYFTNVDWHHVTGLSLAYPGTAPAGVDCGRCVVIGTAGMGLSDAALRTLLRHEFTLAMGLPQSADCSALMASPTVCGPIPAGRTWTAHDMTHLVSYYGNHPKD